jgi:peroxiredoxin
VKLDQKKSVLGDLGIQIIPISISDASEAMLAKEKSKSSFNFYCDPKSTFSKHFGLLHKSGHPFNGTDISQIGKVLVNSQGFVLWTHFTNNSRVRLTSDLLVDQLRKNITSL